MLTTDAARSHRRLNIQRYPIAITATIAAASKRMNSVKMCIRDRPGRTRQFSHGVHRHRFFKIFRGNGIGAGARLRTRKESGLIAMLKIVPAAHQRTEKALRHFVAHVHIPPVSYTHLSCRQTSFTVCFSENQVKVNAFMLPDGGADPNFPNGGQ